MYELDIAPMLPGTHSSIHTCLIFCDPVDCSPLGSVHGIIQARILEWVAILSSRRSSQPREQTWVSCIADGFFYYLSHQGSPHKLTVHFKSFLPMPDKSD